VSVHFALKLPLHFTTHRAMRAIVAQERWLRPGAEYVQHLGDESPAGATADGDGPSSTAADSGKSLNRQNFELGISRDYTV